MLASVFESVGVANRNGKKLMPCHPAKARILLRQGKALPLKKGEPFAVRLLYGSSGYRQPITLGVDSGYSKIGLSAVAASKEAYAAEVTLRTDMVKLNAEKSQYRRGRRYRHTWYRQPRFDNRSKPAGWIAPSLLNKLDTHIKAIEEIKQILPITSVVVEVAAFDIQKIRNPEISGVEYQNGPQKGFWNVREYVLYRDGHKCRHCRGKSKDPVLEVHHRESRQTGGDRPEHLYTLCKTCHSGVSQGKIILKLGRSPKGFKAETFMTMVRWKLIEKLRTMGTSVSHTYGYITKQNRIAMELPKSHINDGFASAGGTADHARSALQYFVRQVRKCNRKLRKGDRSHIKNTAPRFINGFQRYDKVRWKNNVCFIFGRRTSGYFDLRKLDGTKLCASVKSSEITLLESAKTLIKERMRIPLHAGLQPSMEYPAH